MSERKLRAIVKYPDEKPKETMLEDGYKTISEICFSTGFNNISNFNRQFKKNTGCSPMQYRKRFLADADKKAE